MIKMPLRKLQKARRKRALQAIRTLIAQRSHMPGAVVCEWDVAHHLNTPMKDLRHPLKQLEDDGHIERTKPLSKTRSGNIITLVAKRPSALDEIRGHGENQGTNRPGYGSHYPVDNGWTG